MWDPVIRDGKLEADAELRSLLVLFTGGRFDGYYWTALGKTPKPQSGATRR
jgi:hypothetical protein